MFGRLTIFILVLIVHTINGFELSSYVAGGEEAKEAPWIVSLQLKEGDFAYCGATLISTTLKSSKAKECTCDAWVATAASCLQDAPDSWLSPSEIIATIGNLNLADKDAGFQGKILELVPHEKYAHENNTNDVGLILMEYTETAESETECCKITVPSLESQLNLNETLYDDVNATFYGWGLREENGLLQKQLQYTPAKLMTQRDCFTAYEGSFWPESMRCATSGLNQGPCSHDTGGPLICEYKSTDETPFFFLCGIASFGRGCQSPSPAVYTDTFNSSITAWIQEKIAPAEHIL